MIKPITFVLLAAALFGQVHAGGHEGADKGADLAKAESCIQCHEKVAVSLKGTGTDAIAAQIKAIANGELSHPPVLEGASDADIAEVARLLNEKS